MEKQLIIQRLKATIEMLKGLKPEHFYFNDFVKQWAPLENCGTVCCVAGWYPKYFPESNLEWKATKSGSGHTLGSITMPNIDVTLIAYHGLKMEAINYLFYGYSEVDDMPYLNEESDLRQVTDGWQAFTNLFESTDTLNHLIS